LNHLCEKVNSIEAGLEDLSAMKETLDKLEVAVLAKVSGWGRVSVWFTLQGWVQRALPWWGSTL